MPPYLFRLEISNTVQGDRILPMLIQDPLKMAPHTALEVTADDWSHPYSRKIAAYPLNYLVTNKFWTSVARVDNAFGDRNLICTCPSISEYEMEEA